MVEIAKTNVDLTKAIEKVQKEGTVDTSSNALNSAVKLFNVVDSENTDTVKLSSLEKEQEEIATEIKEKKEKYEQIVAQIKKATENLEENARVQKQKAIVNAISNYNKEEDGDWNTYLQNELKDVLPDVSLKNLIANLTQESTKIVNEIGTLQSDLENVSINLENENNKVQAAKSANKAKEAQAADEVNMVEAADETGEATASKAAQTPYEQALEEVKGLVSAEEWAAIEEMGIDLTEKNQDGSPKYIFAKGSTTGAYHVYQAAPTINANTSCEANFINAVARQKYGMRLVPMGDGAGTFASGGNFGIGRGMQSTAYYIDCEGKHCKEGCSSTCSPLSFDLNGDGVKTSNEIINYDIDGDGIVDKINNSADAVLVFDKDGDGISGKDGSECFGNNTDLDNDGVKDGFNDGFEALKALAKKEGMADDNKIDSDEIKTLEEKYGFKIKENGYEDEAKSLLDVGITEINLAQTDETTLNKNFDGKENDLMTQKGATFKINGVEKNYADIWHSKKDEDENVVEYSKAEFSKNVVGTGGLAYDANPFLNFIALNKNKKTAKNLSKIDNDLTKEQQQDKKIQEANDLVKKLFG